MFDNPSAAGIAFAGLLLLGLTLPCRLAFGSAPPLPQQQPVTEPSTTSHAQHVLADSTSTGGPYDDPRSQWMLNVSRSSASSIGSIARWPPLSPVEWGELETRARPFRDAHLIYMTSPCPRVFYGSKLLCPDRLQSKCTYECGCTLVTAFKASARTSVGTRWWQPLKQVHVRVWVHAGGSL